MKNIVLIIAMALLNIGVLAQTETDLTAEKWYPLKINGEIVNNPKMFLKLNKNDKSISGNGGCNEIYGKYGLKGKKIQFREISMTKMFCSEQNVMNWESNFVNALKKIKSFVVNGDQLLLSGDGKTVIQLSSEKTTAENSNLSGRKWVLKKFNYSDVPPTEKTAFIVFDKEKETISGSTSCNLFNGKYRVNGRYIMFSEIISTKMACFEGKTMEVEMKFLEGLNKTEWFSILNEKLTLSIGRFNLLTFEEQK